MGALPAQPANLPPARQNTGSLHWTPTCTHHSALGPAPAPGPSPRTLQVQVPLSAFPVTYKYAVREADGSLSLEHGENRMVTIPHSEPHRLWPAPPGCAAAAGAACPSRSIAAASCDCCRRHHSGSLLAPALSPADEASCRAPALVARNDGYFRHERRWRGAGVAAPVFSLRSQRSVGCGEFADLCELVDFCAAAGGRRLHWWHRQFWLRALGLLACPGPACEPAVCACTGGRTA